MSEYRSLPGVDMTMGNYSSELLTLDGAVDAGSLSQQHLDAGVAAHYGDPLREQRALAEGVAVVDLSHRGVVTVTGPDRLSWMFTLSSQDVKSLAPGGSAHLLLLSLQGRIEFDVHATDDGETLWLLVDGAQAAELAQFLDSMRFMLRVKVADRSADFGGLASTRQLPLPGPVFTDPWPEVQPGGASYSATLEHPGSSRPWFEHVVPLEGVGANVQSLREHGFTLAGVTAAEALRIAAWEPRQLLDADERAIPHELDLLRTAVHLAKGCYKGQETVARVHNLGHPPRRLTFLHLDGSANALPEHGASVTLDGRSVGTVTSAALHYELGPVALAVLKRNVDPAAELQIEVDDVAVAAAQELIVSPDAGQVVGRAKGFLRPPR